MTGTGGGPVAGAPSLTLSRAGFGGGGGALRRTAGAPAISSIVFVAASIFSAEATVFSWVTTAAAVLKIGLGCWKRGTGASLSACFNLAICSSSWLTVVRNRAASWSLSIADIASLLI